jgi:signal transduction histidine kinase
VDRARTVEIASAGAHVLLGFKPDHKPFPLAPLIHPDERDQVLEVVQTAVAANHPFAIEYRLRHARGDWRTVWEQGHPTRHAQQPAVQGQLLDVTQRLQRGQARLATEFRLLQAQKFHALNHLAAGVAHEFNNLIAGILGSAELLAMDLAENHPGQESLKQIFEASNHARDFVHKLRVLGQRPSPDFKAVRLQPVIEECLQILRTIISARVELQADVSPDCPKVNADAAQIHQAILDLCLHSWQGLADRRGRITISLKNCPVVRLPAGASSLPQPGPHVCLTVQDDSPGLEKSARDHIFHPFRNRRAGGKKVGLELFLVRETIRAHQGEIFLESEAGHGLAFRIYLPVTGEK